MASSSQRNTKMSDKCPHCQASFIMSSVRKKSSTQLHMYCCGCHKSYVLADTKGQREKLTNVPGEPSQLDTLTDIGQLQRGDIIAFKRFKGAYHHHAVVVKVDFDSDQVHVIEFQSQNVCYKASIKRKVMDFCSDIATGNVFVRRYMPLDCLSTEEVVEKAENLVRNPKSQPKYDAFMSNCQHMSSWCKTGRMKSLEGSFYRNVYSYVIKGVQVVSLFLNPYIQIGTVVISAAEALRSMRSLKIEYGLLADDMKEDSSELWLEVGMGVAGLALTAGLLYCAWKKFSSPEEKRKNN